MKFVSSILKEGTLPLILIQDQVVFITDYIRRISLSSKDSQLSQLILKVVNGCEESLSSFATLLIIIGIYH